MPEGQKIGPSCPSPLQPQMHDCGPNLVETGPRLVENLPLGRLRCLCALRGLLSHKPSCILGKIWSPDASTTVRSSQILTRMACNNVMHLQAELGLGGTVVAAIRRCKRGQEG